MCFHGKRGYQLLETQWQLCLYMLDASKAFDRLNLLTLFKTLYYRGMCPIYLRL